MNDTSENDLDEEKDIKIKKILKEVSLFHWGKLRFIGSLRLLSVIPVIGVGIISILNLPHFKDVKVGVLLTDTWTGGALIIFVIGLFLSHMIYHIFCPPIVRKFDGAADFYHHQLQIKKSQLETYPDDEFHADLNHIAIHYKDNLNKSAFARWVSLLLLFFSFTSLGYFIYMLRIFLVGCTLENLTSLCREIESAVMI